jgi:hypothetical protein
MRMLPIYSGLSAGDLCIHKKYIPTSANHELWRWNKQTLHINFWNKYWAARESLPDAVDLEMNKWRHGKILPTNLGRCMPWTRHNAACGLNGVRRRWSRRQQHQRHDSGAVSGNGCAGVYCVRHRCLLSTWQRYNSHLAPHLKCLITIHERPRVGKFQRKCKLIIGIYQSAHLKLCSIYTIFWTTTIKFLSWIIIYLNHESAACPEYN